MCSWKKIDKDSKIISLYCAIYDQSSRPWDENASSNSTQLDEILSWVEFAVKYNPFFKELIGEIYFINQKYDFSAFKRTINHFHTSFRSLSSFG